VQKSYERIVVFTINVSQIKNIKKVGIRGEKPLSWDSDLEIIKGKDSLYKAIVSFETGYKFAQYKFTVNDQFELQNQDNRRVIFDEKKDTTFYKATFNSLK
jgi:uncharacterized heparinase superfamily protein